MKAILFYIAMITANFPGVELDPKQTKCIAHAVYHEARGEPIMGQVAVAYVIKNRRYSKRYPDTFCEVVYQRHQFTDIKHTKPDYDSAAWKQAAEIAAYTQIGLIDDQTNGATMYHNPIKAPTPRWNFGKLQLVGNLENHRFYKEIL